ncbi:MAG: hypothetical protein GQE15_08150 [Archangiaceae bacterium]|nr:hypothetical protein [Archangiaceae bacterium]
MKRWGVISAKPSEFLIRMRGGEVISSGQGATVFKWPWDSVAIVPTTVQRLQFTADQITQEKVGVKVTGIVVYRIAEPLIAFRMLNFSFPERAQEKLATMMEEMCIGATRRLVANLTVEECLTRRKDALASELVREVAPVVSGSGRVEDSTSSGWGLLVDTIEIQDVRVTSAQVFANMQARFRQEQERVAREAELVTEQDVELARVSTQTEVRRKKQLAEENAKLEKIAGDAKVEEQRVAQERHTRANQVAAEREFQLAKIQAEQEVRQRKQLADEAAAIELQQAQARIAEAKQANEARLQQERLRNEVEVARLEAEAEQARHASRVAEELQQAEVMRTRADVAEAKRQLAEIEAKTVELEVHKQALLTKLELDRASRIKDIENTLSPEAIQLAVAHRLPELAMAFQQKMGEVHVTAVDGANPFGYIAAAVEGVMGLARSAGLELPKKPEGS